MKSVICEFSYYVLFNLISAKLTSSENEVAFFLNQ